MPLTRQLLVPCNGIGGKSSASAAVEATGANVTVIFVPSRGAPDAMFEAADAGIPLIVCITEGIPVQDMMRVREYLDQKQVRLLGPNCPGLLTPGEAKVGIVAVVLKATRSWAYKQYLDVKLLEPKSLKKVA